MNYSETKIKGIIRESIYKAFESMIKKTQNPYTMAHIIEEYAKIINEIVDKAYKEIESCTEGK